MTERQLYDNVLSELNKVEAPSLLLEDFVYIANKGVQQFTNKAYNRYEIGQQSTDDLRALKVTTRLSVDPTDDLVVPTEDKRWISILPDDYLHLLNCVVVFEKEIDESANPCKERKIKPQIKSIARRLTSDMYPNIMNNAYFKPSYKTPYYFISNVLVDDNGSLLESILDPNCGNINIGNISSNSVKLSKILDPCGDISDENNTLKLEIRCGSNKRYYPSEIFIDYLKVPQKINLTYDDLESVQDNTRTLEFPEYVCYEIVNEVVKLILENSSDPRLQTNIPINQTIGDYVSQTK